MSKGPPVIFHPDYMSARLWDVEWEDGGLGKHGRGPWATQSQAEACIRAVGWPGRPVLAMWTIHKEKLARIRTKLKSGLPERGTPPQARAK